MIGQIVSHYRIVEKLGEGGMGDVYQAEDMRLKRVVALKFLPPHLTRDPEAIERLIFEAQTVSALDHQNVCTVHEIDRTDDGQIFICMACYEGETLKQRITRGPLQLKEAVDISIQIARGLAKAHEKGIVHRDLKPGNLMVQSDSTIKIIDFGLSKLLGTDVTQAGTTMGTVAYMSPEQITGKSIDPGADIWALGVVLYEMLTGERPFKGAVEQTVIYSILNEEPKPLKELRPEIPIAYERIVAKCLRKKPGERYKSMDEVVHELEKGYLPDDPASIPIGLSTSVSSKPGTRRFPLRAAQLVGLLVFAVFTLWLVLSISEQGGHDGLSGGKKLAVLPFENFGPPGDEYFADGITDEITARLAALQGLVVISRSSVQQYKNTARDIRQVGKELGVDYVLEGGVRWHRKPDASNEIRITPQLIRVSDATHVWAQVYERNLADIFELQSAIARQVVAALGITLLQREKQAMEEKPTDDLEAYDYYLRGNDYIQRSNSHDDMRIALDMYQKAIVRDSSFVRAYARLAYAHLKMYHWGIDRSKTRLASAKQALNRAFQIGPDLPETQVSRGYYYYWGLADFDRALEQFTLARAHQPNSSELSAAMAYVQRRQGKWNESLQNLKKALELNPNSSRLALNLGHIHHFIRHYPEAEQYYDRAISIAPDITEWYLFKALLYLSWNGSLEQAKNELMKASQQSGMEKLIWYLTTYEGYRLLLRIFYKEYKDAFERASLRPIASDTVSFFYLSKAMFYGLLNQPNSERAYYDSARMVFEAKTQKNPEQVLFHINLAYAYAGLGRKEEAIQEGKKATALLPVSKDVVQGTELAWKLAETYVLAGEHRAAMDQLMYLLSIPGFHSTAWLRVDPIWNPLREYPQFQKLLKGL